MNSWLNRLICKYWDKYYMFEDTKKNQKDYCKQTFFPAAEVATPFFVSAVFLFSSFFFPPAAKIPAMPAGFLFFCSGGGLLFCTVSSTGYRNKTTDWIQGYFLWLKLRFWLHNIRKSTTFGKKEQFSNILILPFGKDGGFLNIFILPF